MKIKWQYFVPKIINIGLDLLELFEHITGVRNILDTVYVQLFVWCLCYSEEQECLNVWTAYLNFENLYGTQSQVDEVLRQAQLKVDPVTIQRRLCDIYARSGKLDVSDWQSLLYSVADCSYFAFLYVTVGFNNYISESFAWVNMLSLP